MLCCHLWTEESRLRSRDQYHVQGDDDAQACRLVALNADPTAEDAELRVRSAGGDHNPAEGMILTGGAQTITTEKRSR